MASGVSGVVSFGISILRDGHRHIVQTVRAAQIVRRAPPGYGYPNATVGVTSYGVSEWSRSQLCGLSQCVCDTQIRRPKRETNAPPRVLIQRYSSVLIRSRSSAEA